MNRFEDQVVLITGGNSGIGLAAAKAFAGEGARVVITGRDEASLERARTDIGAETLAVRADVTSAEDLDRLFARIGEVNGHIDVLFANAGIARFGTVDAVTERVYDDVMGTNVRGMLFTLQKALPLLAPGGAVILNSSIAAELSSAAGMVYAASKAAVRSLGRTFAMTVIERGIRVNVISPGPIETPIYDGTPGLLERFTTAVPMKRHGTAEEVASAVLFLASADASYITGVDLPVDGGVIGLG
ncbi:MAG TPA: SDR family oxidoreductase [Thermoanaerobaculia bacterium]|nr:SDR family oxidoreductase [Thermoanaerobaculia bacterium]